MVELMFVLAIAGILLALGVPAFNDVILGAKASTIANDLLASVQLARSEAIKRNVPITLCSSTDGATCATSTDWETGWVVVVLDPVTAAVIQVIQVEQAAPEHFKVHQAGIAADLVFQPIGVGATTAAFTVCRVSPVGSQERVLTVSATGSTFIRTTEAGVCP